MVLISFIYLCQLIITYFILISLAKIHSLHQMQWIACRSTIKLLAEPKAYPYSAKYYALKHRVAHDARKPVVNFQFAHPELGEHDPGIFFNLFGKGPLRNFRHFNINWENFFIHFYIIFLNRDPKTALNHSYSWLYALY